MTGMMEQGGERVTELEMAKRVTRVEGLSDWMEVLLAVT